MPSLRLPVIVLLLIIAILPTGCQRAGQQANPPPADIVLTMAVEPEPARVGEATLVFTLKTATGQGIPNARLNIRGDMSHAGMQPVLATADSGPDGVYRVPFRWTMAGDWFVLVQVELPDGRRFEQRFDLRVAG